MAEKEKISWAAPEYDHQQRDALWYLASIIIAAILLIVALWQRNYLFAVFIILAEIAVIIQANRFPPIWDFEIGGDGVKIGDKKFITYGDIEGFDIHPDTEHYNHLVLRVHSRFRPDVKIRIPAAESGNIEARLLEILERREYEPHPADALARFLKF